MVTATGRADSEACVLKVSGDFDSTSVQGVRDSLDAALGEGFRSIVLDLSGVTYMDSSALGFVVWADQRLQPVAGRLALAGANADVARILELTGLIGVAPSIVVSASLAEALSGGVLTYDRSGALWVESFEFAADASRLASARTRLGEIIAPLGLSDSAVFDIKVAVGEALANAVRHGSPRGQSDTVCVEVRAYADRVDIVVSDDGCGYDGAIRPSRDAFAPSGRGVLFMRALMDAVEFCPGIVGGTSVVLAKRRFAPA